MTTAELPVIPRAASARLGLGAQVSYGAGQVAGQVFRDVPSLLLLFFMTNALGVPPALAGASIFIPKLVWGIICDLGVGALSDRFKGRVARRWWLLAGALGAPVAMILLFHVPDASIYGKAAYVTAAFSLYMMVFAIFSVPYLAIAGELSSDSHQRTVLMAWRLVFTAIGVLISSSLAPIFIQSQGGGQPAYERMSEILAIICPLALVIAFFGAGRASGQSNFQAVEVKSQGFPVREAMAALGAPKFSVLLFANLLQLAGGGMAYASMLYFLTYNMARADSFKQIGIIGLISAATIILSQPAWVALARRFGKKWTYVASSFMYSGLLAFWALTGGVSIEVSYVLGAILGVANSGWTLMGFSMVSDVADDGRAGLYASVWVAADKIGFALGGTLLTGLILSGFGFDASRAVAGLPQSASAVTGVMVAFGMGPGLLSLAAGLIFSKWGRLAQHAAAGTSAA